MLSKDLSLKFKVIRILDNHDYSSVHRNLIRDTGCSDEYSKRVIKELANYLALKVFEKDFHNTLLKCSGVIKRAWKTLVLNNTFEYCSLCKSLMLDDNSSGTDYIIHYTDDDDDDDDSELLKKQLTNTIRNYEFYFGPNPPEDIWEHLTDNEPSLSSTSSSLQLSFMKTNTTVTVPKVKKEEFPLSHKLLNPEVSSSSSSSSSPSSPPPLLTKSINLPKKKTTKTKNLTTPSPPTATSTVTVTTSSLSLPSSKKVKIKKPINDSNNIGKLRVALLNNYNPLFQTSSYADFTSVKYKPIEDHDHSSSSSSSSSKKKKKKAMISCLENVWYAIGIIDENNTTIMSDTTGIKLEITSDSDCMKPITHISECADYKKHFTGSYYFCAIDECHFEGKLRLKFSAVSNDNDNLKGLPLIAEPLICYIDVSKNNNESIHSLKRKGISNEQPYYKILKDDKNGEHYDDDDDDDESIFNKSKKRG